MLFRLVSEGSQVEDFRRCVVCGGLLSPIQTDGEKSSETRQASKSCSCVICTFVSTSYSNRVHLPNNATDAMLLQKFVPS